MRSLVIATTNPDKLREIRGVLEGVPVQLVSLLDLPPVPEPEETGATFEENARQKALFYDAALRTQTASRVADQDTARFTVAEDSGLAIDALDGEPGVHSARFLRPDASYPERFAEIYARLRTRPGQPRSARFVCALAVVRDGVLVYETTGVIEGIVADAPRGDRGFGYDPIFYYPPYARTLAEVTEAEKLRVAHRGRAFRRLASWLESGRNF